jgi:hypothetical protein
VRCFEGFYQCFPKKDIPGKWLFLNYPFKFY